MKFSTRIRIFKNSQSGFLPGDSCISQLLSIVHDINSSSDCDPAQYVMDIFLDISKAFDKVWHDGLLFKLKTYVVEGELLNLLLKSSLAQLKSHS